jgi:hypothetical protein
MSLAALGIVLIAAALPDRILSEPAGYSRPAADPYTTLTVHARCSPTRRRAADVTLGWSTTRPGVTALRVEITDRRDGFAKDKLVTSVELPPGERTFEFPNGLAGAYYYWRLLVKTEQGWAYAANGRFDAPICPSDKDEEEERE